jgi:hypothetical protein
LARTTIPATTEGSQDARRRRAIRVDVQLRVAGGPDKAYDVSDFIATLRQMELTPHVAQNTSKRRSAIDRRTTRHPGYAVSQRKRKLVEQAFGWIQTVGGLRKLRHRGGPLVTWMFTFTAAAYNIVRLRRLLPAGAY